ncbi:hypothetical protein PRIPAC_78727 [Pristionchus pacificus]|uniref:Uncharacterized protein n=1 Tax=Pristionchus pacificus TaxID=54126 RepID=A0A2A6CKR9_PRIPA|nr:hypothetical protein PRIPAC_78727 [Pristionchus pacificus]|eukprot:PDM78814.1 hypothetical protein PRIPAC_31393 [Pristionchus pacificus]
MLFKLCITTDTAYAFSGDSSDIGPCGTAPLPVPGAYVSGATEEERDTLTFFSGSANVPAVEPPGGSPGGKSGAPGAPVDGHDGSGDDCKRAGGVAGTGDKKCPKENKKGLLGLGFLGL